MVYTFRLYENEAVATPDTLLIPYAGRVTRVRDIATGADVPYEVTEKGVLVRVAARPRAPIADGFALIND